MVLTILGALFSIFFLSSQSLRFYIFYKESEPSILRSVHLADNVQGSIVQFNDTVQASILFTHAHFSPLEKKLRIVACYFLSYSDQKMKGMNRPKPGREEARQRVMMHKKMFNSSIDGRGIQATYDQHPQSSLNALPFTKEQLDKLCVLSFLSPKHLPPP